MRGIVLTDALIGTFASAHGPDLLANRCFLYHVIGGGTGHWDVPVGGMGTVAAELAAAAERRGAELVTGREVTAIETDGATATVTTADGRRLAARQVFANVAPAVLDRLLGEAPTGPAPEGAQVKVNMLLSRLPRLRDRARRPGAGLRRHVPRQRGLRAARAGLPPGRRRRACPTSCRARSTATR